MKPTIKVKFEIVTANNLDTFKNAVVKKMKYVSTKCEKTKLKDGYSLTAYLF